MFIHSSTLYKPHALLWGPDNQIWLTERATGKILRVNPESGSPKNSISGS